MAIELFNELLRWSQEPNLKYWFKFVIDFSVYWGRPNGTRTNVVKTNFLSIIKDGPTYLPCKNLQNLLTSWGCTQLKMELESYLTSFKICCIKLC